MQIFFLYIAQMVHSALHTIIVVTTYVLLKASMRYTVASMLYVCTYKYLLVRYYIISCYILIVTSTPVYSAVLSEALM